MIGVVVEDMRDIGVMEGIKFRIEKRETVTVGGTGIEMTGTLTVEGIETEIEEMITIVIVEKDHARRLVRDTKCS